MKVLKWVCFILVCLDVIAYIIQQANNIQNESKSSGKIGRFVGLCIGIAARVFVLYGAGTCWLTV